MIRMHSVRQAQNIDSSQELQATVHQLQLSKNARADEISEIKALLTQYKQNSARSRQTKEQAPSSSAASASAGPLLLGTSFYPEGVPVDVLDRRLGTLEEANALFSQFQRDLEEELQQLSQHADTARTTSTTVRERLSAYQALLAHPGAASPPGLLQLAQQAKTETPSQQQGTQTQQEVGSGELSTLAPAAAEQQGQGFEAGGGSLGQPGDTAWLSEGPEEQQGGEAASLWNAMQEAARQRAAAESALMQAFEPGSYSPLWRALMPDSPQDTPSPISAEPSEHPALTRFQGVGLQEQPASVPFAELSSDAEAQQEQQQQQQQQQGTAAVPLAGMVSQTGGSRGGDPASSPAAAAAALTTSSEAAAAASGPALAGKVTAAAAAGPVPTGGAPTAAAAPASAAAAAAVPSVRTRRRWPAPERQPSQSTHGTSPLPSQPSTLLPAQQQQQQQQQEGAGAAEVADAVAQAEQRRALQRLGQLTTECEQAAAWVTKLRGERQQVSSDLSRLQQQRKEAAEEVARLQEQRQQVAADVERLHAEKQQSMADLAKLRLEQQALASSVEASRQQLDKITSEAEDLQHRADGESVRLKRVRSERETEDRGFAAAVQRWEEAVAGRKAQLAELEAKVRELERELLEGRRRQEQQQQQQQQQHQPPLSPRFLENAQKHTRGSLPHKHGLESLEQPSEPSPSAAPAAAAAGAVSAEDEELQAALEASESPRLRTRRRAKRQAIRRSYSCGELSPAGAVSL
ncbi:hypothetical protein DUNSADRAFT_14980 [Dunaliella salina]|uniref:Uncharacterized protein n=1 Tax=Dunaliella salina TaxID=3046 RepID=A0ABQ7H274_DUNSA|nr:hypothetical protein DUNSADRAFT_14980 [Dunaliella salina]|eukprot:KAF5840956.1 hypothetical protein DUNSADRAFT_14980 [Dunaliella salina]